MSPQEISSRNVPRMAATEGGPRVVFGVPMYNNAEFLPSALDSLLAQAYRNFALVLVDHASGDGTAEFAEAYAAREPNVALFRHVGSGS
jgi:glycosyltransferase involved in cell wall biosynthesis